MTLVALGSAKGSPGVTTVVAALAARWPDHRRLLVVECDPAGADLAARLGLGPERGLVALAAEGRRALTPDMLWQQTQPLPGSTSAQVLAGPASAEQATAALAALSSRLAALLAGLDGIDVVADCGRLDPASPAMAMVRAAELVVLVARPSISQLHHLAARVQALGPGLPTALLLVGDRPYGVSEAGRAVGVEPLGTIAEDARAADLLTGGDIGRSRVLRASALMRTGRTVAEQLTARMEARPARPSPVPAPNPVPRVWEVAPEPEREPMKVPEPKPEPAPASSAPSPVRQPAPAARSRTLGDQGGSVAASSTSTRPPDERPRRTVRARPLQARPRPPEAARPRSAASLPAAEELPDGPR